MLALSLKNEGGTTVRPWPYEESFVGRKVGKEALHTKTRSHGLKWEVVLSHVRLIMFSIPLKFLHTKRNTIPFNNLI